MCFGLSKHNITQNTPNTQIKHRNSVYFLCDPCIPCEKKVREENSVVNGFSPQGHRERRDSQGIHSAFLFRVPCPYFVALIARVGSPEFWMRLGGVKCRSLVISRLRWECLLWTLCPAFMKLLGHPALLRSLRYWFTAAVLEIFCLNSISMTCNTI